MLRGRGATLRSPGEHRSCSTGSWAGEEEQETKTQKREGDTAQHSINIRQRHETVRRKRTKDCSSFPSVFNPTFWGKMGQQFTNTEEEQGEIDVAELQEWYKKFVVECPSGTLFMHEFKRFFGVQDNQEAAEYVENMFRAFDKNGVSAEKVLQVFV